MAQQDEAWQAKAPLSKVMKLRQGAELLALSLRITFWGPNKCQFLLLHFLRHALELHFLEVIDSDVVCIAICTT